MIEVLDETQQVMDEDQLMRILGEIVTEDQKYLLPYLIEECNSIVQEVHDLRAFYKGHKHLTGRTTAMTGKFGESGRMRFIARIPATLYHLVPILTKDPKYWQDKQNWKHRFKEFLVVDPWTL